MKCFYPDKFSRSTTAAPTTLDPIGNACFIRKVKFRGFDIGVVEAADAFQCAYECSFLEGCNHFSYNLKSRRCNLKKTVRGRTVDRDFVSGDVDCFFPDKVTTTTRRPPRTTTTTASLGQCYLPSTDFFGNTISMVTVKHVTNCYTACLSHKHCRFFSWESATGICYLKDSDAGKTHKRGTISGDMSCFHPGSFTTPEPVTRPTENPTTTVDVADPCYRLKTSYYGPIVATFDAHSPALCMSLCRRGDTCSYFTWNQLTRKCYLHSEVHGKHRNNDTVSGEMKCFFPGDYTTTTTSTTPCPTTTASQASDCFLANVNFVGKDVELIENVTSAVQCSLECRKVDECHFFSYVTGSRRCYLKYSDVNTVTTAGVVSGSRKCFFPGDYTTTTTRACPMCPLSSTVPYQTPATTTIIDPTPPEPCVNGPCPTIKPPGANVCLVHGLRYSGTTVEQAKSSSPDACGKLCLSSSICEFFTFYDGACQIFEQAHEEEAPHEFVSGNWECLNGEPF